MRRFECFLNLCPTIFLIFGFSEIASGNFLYTRSVTGDQDTLPGKQILYNGRVWRNLYYKVMGDQFLFSNEFLQGSVTINGKSFKNIVLRYDIYNDEIMTITDHGTILQLNKEMADMFTIKYDNILHQFSRFEADSVNKMNGYVDVLYRGNTALYVKYKKEIEPLAVEKKYDSFYSFYQSQKIYILKGGMVHQVKRRKDLIGLLSDNKQQIRNFIKNKKIKVSRKRPESFVAVMEFYDSLSR